MKKRYIFGAAMALFVAATAGAQVRIASQPEKLISSNVGLMAPVWSPDGSKIAVTSDNYTGIFVANADGSNLTQLTADAGAGYKMVWSDDSRSIIGNAKLAQGRQLVKETRSYNLATGAVKAITPRRRTVAQPGADNAAGIFGKMIANPAGATSSIAALAQFKGKTVINPALSPDGSKIAFQIPGNGMWLINADGSGLRSLGQGSHPAWMPDSKNIIYTIVKDNGSMFTASTLMSANTENGKTSVLVASEGLIPMTPAVAPDGTRLVFENAIDASIYLVNLKK